LKIAALEHIPATYLLMIAICALQIGSVLAISLFERFGPLGTLFLRMSVAGLMLCIFYRAAVRSALQQAPLGILLLGAAMTLQSGTFYEALARIPLGVAVSIEFLGPILVALATSRRWIDVVCVALAAFGVFLFTPSVNSIDLVGVIFALGAAAGWALFIILSRRLGKALEGGVGLALAMTVSGMILFPLIGLRTIPAVADTPESIPVILLVAVFSAAIPLLFEFLALKTMPPRKFGVLIALEPVIATIAGVLFLADKIGLRSYLAIFLITLASILIALLDRAPTQNDERYLRRERGYNGAHDNTDVDD
jgi:inner membrane transporter RhtA